MDNLISQSLQTLIDGLNQKQFSSVELTEAYIKRTQQVEDKVKAFLSYDIEKTLNEAKASDQRRAHKEQRSELDGIPIGLKDIFAETSQKLTCGSRMLEHFESPYDATVVRKLKDAGCVLWGRVILGIWIVFLEVAVREVPRL